MDVEELFRRHGSERDQLADAMSASDLYTRQYGAELTRWESQLMQQFQEKETARLFRYRGFVHHTRDTTLVLLTPSPWLMEGEFIFFDRDQELPPDGAYIEVVGSRVAAPRPLQDSQTVIKAIAAESWNTLSVDFLSDVRPPMKLKELSNILFETVGMAEASKRVFARLFVSSPPYQDSIGGLTTGIQAIASKAQVRLLLSFIRNILPTSMKGLPPSFRSVQGIKVKAPRLWRFDVGSYSANRMQQICVQRRDPAGYREVSLGALTEAETASLPDVPLALASEDFWVETGNPSHLRLPILKSAITYQMLTPEIGKRSIDSGTEHVLSRLETLRESFGLKETALARGNLLDADALGRPLSTLRIARSTARAYWNDKVTAKDMKHAWNRVLEPALKEFMELTELKEGAEKDWGKGSRIDKFNTNVLKAIKKLDSGKRGSLGPTLQEIAEEAGVERHVAAETLARMKDSGVLYEPRPGHYRLV
ncbi:MAG: hypothetical protein ThorAB25_14290 [Candidatus Thorarchaeota archaeon AB_25]|nr:MAG: hypothetical protein ThorAB25_14290 [Candidatus Thorarchaeota archaeon AB_25]